MLFALYAPVPHVTVGSKEISRSVKGALAPLAPGEIDPAFQLAKDVLCAVDAAGFDLCLYAERHLGADFEAMYKAESDREPRSVSSQALLRGRTNASN